MLRIYGTVIRGKRKGAWDNAKESGNHNYQGLSPMIEKWGF